jgi:hypothetical protein
VLLEAAPKSGTKAKKKRKKRRRKKTRRQPSSVRDILNN